ncbi:MAG: 30S ribosomal protein S1 [Bdellovibrionales bacterium]|nr:30S ribosomal protein S1 [Bdellovibrionales bacterium]
MSLLATEKKKKSRSHQERDKALAVLNEGDRDFPVHTADQSSFSTEEFEQLLQSSIQGKEFKAGSVVKGKVIDIKEDFVIVDINYKSEGIIPKSEFRLLKDQEVEIGQEVDVYIDRIENENGAVVLSKDKADISKAWKDIMQATENNETVRGTVIAQVKGGLSVDIGVRAFLPGSQLDIRPVRNIKSFIGQTYDFKVIKVSRKRGNIVLSRRVILAKEMESLPPADEIQKGAVVKGVVKNIMDYGAFIDLGSLDGLLHVTDMSWSRLGHPSEMLSLGQEVEVKVLKFDEEKKRISLGLKQLNEQQWADQASQYSVGSIAKGKVVRLVDYGAFIQLEGGLEGLLHINEISWTKKPKKPDQVLSVGQEVKVKIIDIQKESHKLSLSIKQTEESPWKTLTEKYSVGQVLTGPVASISDFGLFVTVEEGVDGLVHVSDLSWTESMRPAEKYKPGQVVKVKVLDINPTDEKFSLGIKQLEENPWNSVEEQYPIGSRHKVKVTSVLDFGAFVQLDNDIEGLIHISELSRKRIKSPGEVVKEGDEVTAEILTIDKEAKKINLSIRLVESEEAKTEEKPEGSLNAFAKVLKSSLGKVDSQKSKKTEEKDGEDKKESDGGE